jgi:hypothetical protein
MDNTRQKSAYQVQFVGRRKKSHLNPIWKAHAEPKCRTLAWIFLQHKILTANNLAKRGGRMTHFANYVMPHPRPPLIFASGVPSHKMFGYTWQINLGDKTCRYLPRATSMVGGSVCAGVLIKKTEVWRYVVVFSVEHLEGAQQKNLSTNLPGCHRSGFDYLKWRQGLPSRRDNNMSTNRDGSCRTRIVVLFFWVVCRSCSWSGLLFLLAWVGRGGGFPWFRAEWSL